MTMNKFVVPLSKFLERYTVGEALSANSNSLENTVASQLVKNKWRVDLAGTFLVVWYDASYEVGVRISECHHELRQLLLV
jgi:hypothetical protein